MDFALSVEQEQLREVVARALAKHAPVTGPPEGWVPAPPPDDSLAALESLGVFGDEVGLVERALVAEECGYSLAAGSAVLRLAVPRQLLPNERVALAMGRFELDPLGSVSGSATAVPDAGQATSLLVVTDHRCLAVVTVDPVGRGCVVVAAPDDPTGRGAHLVLTEAPATPVTNPAGLLRAYQTMLAAEAVGIARRAYDIAAAHARTREQFGRSIGSFQGIAFAIADSYLRVAVAQSLVHRAAWCGQQLPAGLDRSEYEGRLAVTTALIAARKAAVANCETAIQTLGGMGMTWEHPVHLWYRRALWINVAGPGSADAHDDVAAALLDPTDSTMRVDGVTDV